MLRVSINGREAFATQAQVNALNTMANLPNGGFATINGYKPTTDYVQSPTVNINFISKFSTERLYQRKLEALKSLSFKDLKITNPKLLALTENQRFMQFTECVGKMIESLNKTLTGDRSDAHRQAHDLFYQTVSEGVKVHFKTVKNKGGTELVLHDGLPIVDAIMLTMLEIGRKTIVEGVVKVVNSGEKVLMDHAIMAALKGTGGRLSIKTISLKADNYTDLRIGGEVFDQAEMGQVMAMAATV